MRVEKTLTDYIEVEEEYNDKTGTIIEMDQSIIVFDDDDLSINDIDKDDLVDTIEDDLADIDQDDLLISDIDEDGWVDIENDLFNKFDEEDYGFNPIDEEASFTYGTHGPIDSEDEVIIEEKDRVYSNKQREKPPAKPKQPQSKKKPQVAKKQQQSSKKITSHDALPSTSAKGSDWMDKAGQSTNYRSKIRQKRGTFMTKEKVAEQAKDKEAMDQAMRIYDRLLKENVSDELTEICGAANKHLLTLSAEERRTETDVIVQFIKDRSMQ